jgi:hypothetical protein
MSSKSKKALANAKKWKKVEKRRNASSISVENECIKACHIINYCIF